ncbi:MAG: hypothetical protein LH481_13330 [Burkholderiales bacterium]|nr:hypothetical protein [Burkholderiales bacterium]
MNLVKTSHVMAAMAFAALGLMVSAHATVTFQWSAGATCGNASSVGFTPGGATFQASLCASTTTERGCGFSAILQASDMTAAQQNNFSVTAIARGSNYPDATATRALPMLITNPPTMADFGSTAAPSSPTSVTPGANQLLVTFTFAPQASAANAIYTLNLSTPASEFSTDQGDSTCAAPGNSGAALPVLTLYAGSPPANAPGAPLLSSVDVAPGRAVLNFSQPVNNGGSPISSYTATCAADGQVTRMAAGSGSPITVNGLRGGVFYTCTVTATNSSGVTSGASGAFTVSTISGSIIAPLLLLLLDE